MSSDMIVILTALDLEYQAVREKLTDLRLHKHAAGTRFEVGRVSRGDCRVALALVGKGNHPAAVLAERAIAEFDPAAILFVGVAGALRSDIALGDVVVATHVYAYHGGTSEDDGLKARPRAWEIPHAVDQIARHLKRTGAWMRHLPHGSDARPDVHFGAIAAGEVVQNSTISEQARWLRQHYNDAAAIEMESAGMAQAAHLNRSLPAVVIRGISDRADGTKEITDRAQWQPRAADNAAAFAVALAEELAHEEQDLQSFEEVGVLRNRTTNGTTMNIAMGNARVGVQAQNIYGNVRVTQERGTPTSLAEQIATLRDQIRQARASGQLDDVTYAAAESELEVAAKSLEQGTAQGKKTLMVALKRLRGLVIDITDLAAKVAAVISLTESAS